MINFIKPFVLSICLLPLTSSVHTKWSSLASLSIDLEDEILLQLIVPFSMSLIGLKEIIWPFTETNLRTCVVSDLLSELPFEHSQYSVSKYTTLELRDSGGQKASWVLSVF